MKRPKENFFAWRHYMYRIKVFKDAVVITEENLLSKQHEQVVIPLPVFMAIVRWWNRRSDLHPTLKGEASSPQRR